MRPSHEQPNLPPLGDEPSNHFVFVNVTPKDVAQIPLDDYAERTGQDFPEWTQSDPAAAYSALRQYVIDKRFGGHAARAGAVGLQAQFDVPTVVSVQSPVRPPLKDILNGKAFGRNYKLTHTTEIARIRLAQEVYFDPASEESHASNEARPDRDT
jgi:hypothetical protein